MIDDLKNQLAAANPQLPDLSPGQIPNLPTAGTAVDALTLGLGGLSAARDRLLAEGGIRNI